MKAALVAVLCIALWGAEAQATPVSDDILNGEYKSCMAGEDPQKSPERHQYCLCVRDSMKGWSMEAYGKLAEEESKATDAAHMPDQLKQIGNACMAKIAH